VPPAEWSDYRYFLAICRAGSLSGAARAMRVDQTTVGRRLAALEATVETRLFDRTPDGYSLTAAGESVRADVERIEDAFLAVERRLAGGDARIAGVVRIATTETFATMFILPHLGALRAEHPELALELVTGIQPVDLSRREADLAIRIGAPPTQPNLVVRELGTLRFALYASRNYVARRGRPRTRNGLSGHAIVTYGGEMAAVPIARWMGEHARDATIAFTANTITGVHEAVRAGLGVSVLPCGLGDRDLVRVGAARLGASPIWSVVHEDLVRTARVRAVLAFVAGILRGDRRTNRSEAGAREGARARVTS
jgi:DNA-binding transcriptional LysR family regulator